MLWRDEHLHFFTIAWRISQITHNTIFSLHMTQCSPHACKIWHTNHKTSTFCVTFLQGVIPMRLCTHASAERLWQATTTLGVNRKDLFSLKFPIEFWQFFLVKQFFNTNIVGLVSVRILTRTRSHVEALHSVKFMCFAVPVNHLLGKITHTIHRTELFDTVLVSCVHPVHFMRLRIIIIIIIYIEDRKYNVLFFVRHNVLSTTDAHSSGACGHEIHAVDERDDAWLLLILYHWMVLLPFTHRNESTRAHASTMPPISMYRGVFGYIRALCES